MRLFSICLKGVSDTSSKIHKQIEGFCRTPAGDETAAMEAYNIPASQVNTSIAAIASLRGKRDAD
jgi:hypothetical protein